MRQLPPAFAKRSVPPPCSTVKLVTSGPVNSRMDRSRSSNVVRFSVDSTKLATRITRPPTAA